MATLNQGAGIAGLKLIFACSGAADTGEIADRSARQLTKEGVGRMYCLAGVGGRVPDILETVRSASSMLAIDGCDKDCVKHCLEEAGFKGFGHMRVTDLGLTKGQSPVTGDRIQLAVDAAAKILKA